MTNITNIPAPRVAFMDARTGLMSREWYRFFVNLFDLTGSGTTDTTLVDVQVEPISTQTIDLLPNPDYAALAAISRYEQVLDGLSTSPVQSEAQPDENLLPVLEIGELVKGNLPQVKVASTTLISSSVALANGAGAAAGTLLNAPAAGNPTKWLTVNDNGTARQVPSW